MKNLKNNLEASKELEGYKPVFFPNQSGKVTYFVNEDGDVKTFDGKKVIRIKQLSNKGGYRFISVTNELKRILREKIFNRSIYVHRMVIAAFLYNGDYSKLGRKVVDHINFQVFDNRLSNLQHITQSENLKRKRK